MNKKRSVKKKGIPYVYNRKWRDAKDLKIPEGVKPVIRFKSKISGNTIALEAANRNYGTKIYAANRIKIQGKLVSLYRNFH